MNPESIGRNGAVARRLQRSTPKAVAIGQTWVTKQTRRRKRRKKQGQVGPDAADSERTIDTRFQSTMEVRRTRL
jgi:hypothetical protein